MASRKFAGVALGLVVLLGSATSVLAGTIGPNHITNKPQGWNSPIWVGQSGTTTFKIRYCTSSLGTLKFDMMHHWFALPSTGTAEKSLTCANNSTWRPASWSNGSADYSIEYRSPATITLDYHIAYPD